MSKQKKRARGQSYVEGQEVRSLRPEDDGDKGIIVYASRKHGEWCYGVLMDRQLKAILHKQDELEAV